MSYLFGTRGTAFWKSCVKQNVLSLCLPASPREFPRRSSPAKRLVWIPTVLPEHCDPREIVQPEELWNKNILLGREGKEMGTEYKYLHIHPAAGCVCRGAQQSRSREGALGAAGAEQLGWRGRREERDRSKPEENLQRNSCSMAQQWMRVWRHY